MGEITAAEDAHRASLAIALELGLLPDIAPSQEELAMFLMCHTSERAREEACHLLIQARAGYQELQQTDDAERVAESMRELGCTNP